MEADRESRRRRYELVELARRRGVRAVEVIDDDLGRSVEACGARLDALATPEAAAPVPDLAGLADDLAAAWVAPGVTTRTRQQLVRSLVTSIIADVDKAAREVALTIRWRGGQHSRLRVRKPKPGGHGCRTPEEALAIMARMAGRWPEAGIAASLNRMGVRTGQGKA